MGLPEAAHGIRKWRVPIYRRRKMTDSILHQLHAIAQANGLTAAAWARAAGLHKQNLNSMLKGNREPRESTLVRLAEAAGATITITNAKKP